MKKNYSLTGYAAVLMLLSTTTFTSLAQAKGDEEVSGILTHAIEDDFENGKEKSHLSIHDPKTKKSKKLIFKDGKIPEKLLHAPPGSKIKVKGKKTEDDVTVAYDGSNYDFWLDSNTGIWKATPMTGTKSILAVQVDFNDSLGACGSEATILKNVLDANNLGSTKNYYKTNSQNLIDITGKVARVKLNLNLSSTTTCTEADWNKWSDMADQILNNAGYGVSNYGHRMYFIPPIASCGFGGVAYLGGGPYWTQSKARSWIKSCNTKVIAHELGHNFGFAHAAAGEGTASWDPYGDTSDTMGRGYNQELNAGHKFQVGWIPSAKVQDITANGTFKVAPLNADSASAAYPQIYRVYKSANEYYYISYRDRSGTFDANLPLSYSPRLNITKWKEEFNQYTHFINALGLDGSLLLPSTNVSVKTNAVTASYIEFTVSSGSTTTPSTTDTIKPVVNLTSPANGTVIAAGSPISLSATATDNVAVTKVIFYVNGSAFTDSTAPYALTATMPTGTSVSVKARAYDAAGLYSDSAINYVKNPTTTTADTIKPVVNLTSPANGTVIAAGSPISLSATATDNVAVTKVIFFVNGSAYTDSTAPYALTATMPTGTSVSVKARAYDAAGLYSDSAINYVKNPTTTTADTIKPVVNLTSPANGTVIAAGSPISLSATATDNVAVTKVIFFVNGSAYTDSTAPYALTATMPTGTSVSVKARAYDAAGLYSDSAINYVKNPTTTSTADTTRPVVTITSPLNGSKFASGVTFTAKATATDNVGVTKVTFYFNGKYCTDYSAPYSCNFIMPTGSNLMIRATAYDAAKNYKYSTLVYVSN